MEINFDEFFSRLCILINFVYVPRDFNKFKDYFTSRVQDWQSRTVVLSQFSLRSASAVSMSMEVFALEFSNSSHLVIQSGTQVSAREIQWK